MKKFDNKYTHKMKKIKVSVLLLFVFMITSGIRLVPYESHTNYKKVSAYTIKPGDTLWSIASSELSNHSDIRKMIDEIKNLNNLENEPLQVGETLYLIEDMTIK